MKRVLTILALISLSACGDGGGGGTSTPSNLSSAPGEAALLAYVQSSQSATLTATNDGNTFTLDVGFAPGNGTTTFEGHGPAYSSVETLTLKENGTLLTTNVSTGYFLENPYTPLGKVYGTGSPFALVSNFTPFPTTLTIGATGPVDDITLYHDDTMAVVDGNGTETYTVQANNPTTLLFCINSVTSNVTAQGTADGLADDTEIDCYTVDAAGTATLVSITLNVEGTTLDFQ
jgi:hypothetical protein